MFFTLSVATTAAAQGVQPVDQKKKELIIIPDPSKQRRPDFRDRINVEEPVPADAIRVNLRYRKDYGYKGSTNAFGDVGPTSCDAFSVNVSAGDNNVRQKYLINISSDFTMKEVGGYYVCAYLISELPLNETIRISLTVARDTATEPWNGGKDAQPPAGQQRTILDGKRNVTLNESQPSATLIFEMVYAATPLKLPKQPIPITKLPASPH